MEGSFYPVVSSARGIAVVAPEPKDLAYIHERYLGEVVQGFVRPETRERMLEIAGRLRDRQHVEAIILGGTELPLILRDASTAAIPFLDTTAIHVERIVEEMMG